MADLHDRWVAERRNEHYYKLAKKLNYRSRASFKLIQIDERFGIFKPGDAVVDLGACPGGWCQVAQERTWPNGKVIGVDLRYIKPIEGVETFVGDITHDSTMIELMDRFGGKAIAGHYSMDHARSINLCMYAVDVCDRILKKEGKLVMKVFMGDMFDSLMDELKKRFQSVKVVYVICQGYYGKSNITLKKPEVEEKKPEFTVKGGFI